MKIVLVRHFKVNYNWKAFYNSTEYHKACGEYDESVVLDSGKRIVSDTAVISSSMIRAIETTRLLFDKEPNCIDDSICEVPIYPFMQTTFRLPKIIWDIVGRVQWRLGCKSQPETYTESIKRVQEFLEKIIAADTDSIIVCHGWIIKLAIKHLKDRGFVGFQPVLIDNGDVLEYNR